MHLTQLLLLLTFLGEKQKKKRCLLTLQGERISLLALFLITWLLIQD